MINFRSIHFRLIAWHLLLIIAVCIGFGAYTYEGLKIGLIRETEDNLRRRITQIGEGILAFMPEKGPEYVQRQIETVFNPVKNSRFTRITDKHGRIVYQTGTPKDRSFNPEQVPPLSPPPASLIRYKQQFETGETLLLLAAPFTLKNGDTYIIEVGATSKLSRKVLNELLLKLYFGLPVVALLTLIGGYFLVRNALKPVEHIRASAEEITFNNTLSKRLPVVVTGDNIEQLSHTLNRMINRLEEAYQQASRFSADASHELRTPLTIIRGELETVLHEQTLAPELRERIGSVLEETERLSYITERLFAISRLDAGEAKMHHARFSLADLATDTLEHMQLLAEEKQLIVQNHSSEWVEVEGDPARLKQVIVNLLDNAIKYTPENGTISLRTYATDNKAILEVTDSGIGISRDSLPYIFDRFYRADKVRSREGGSGAGLGLAIARSICLAHNGTIRVESSEGNGSLFVVELPLAQYAR